MSIRRIVVGLDASDNARHALDWAIGLASALDATIVAVHALGLLERLGAQTVPTGTHRAEIVEVFETLWCAALDQADVSNERIVLDGTRLTCCWPRRAARMRTSSWSARDARAASPNSSSAVQAIRWRNVRRGPS